MLSLSVKGAGGASFGTSAWRAATSGAPPSAAGESAGEAGEAPRSFRSIQTPAVIRPATSTIDSSRPSGVSFEEAGCWFMARYSSPVTRHSSLTSVDYPGPISFSVVAAACGVPAAWMPWLARNSASAFCSSALRSFSFSTTTLMSTLSFATRALPAETS
jgi:hypothetical protein